MKKILLSISAFLLCFSVLMAQTDPNRTVKTKIIDALAQLPAQNQAKFNTIMKDIASTGEEGVSLLMGMMNPPGKESNAQIDYALTGLTYYVAVPGREAEKEKVEQAYIKVLSQAQSKGREPLAFVIRQLQVIGTDASVPALSKYLTDKEVAGPAARALASINTAAAQEALVSALQSATADTQNDMINAIGTAKIAAAEPVLLEMLSKPGLNANTEKDLLYAISRCGSKASLSTLAKKAKAANYTMEPTGANEAYIALIKNIAANGDTKTALKEANSLSKKAQKAEAKQSAIAALEIIMATNPEKATSQAVKALKNPCREYRNAALLYAGDDAAEEIIKVLAKADDEVKIDILNWLGVRRQQTTLDAVLPYIQNDNNEIASAAAWAAVKIGGDNAIPALTQLLTGTDQSKIELGKNALNSFNGNINSAVAEAIDAANTDEGKIAGIELLSNRKADAYSAKIMALTSASGNVKKAAYDALQNVVTEKELPQLYTMLEKADRTDVPSIQNAIIAALASQPKEKQFQTIETQMAKSSKKELYYGVLAATGEKKALAQIVEGFNSNDKSQKDAAFVALLKWNGFDAADELYAICKAGQEPYASQALAAYIDKIKQSNLTNENRLIFLRNAMEVAKSDKDKIEILQQIQGTNTFLGLIYAGKFLDEKPIQQAACQAVMNIALNNKAYYGEEVTALLNKVLERLSGQDSDYQKKAIQKHLAEQPQEGGFVSIFNGKDLTGWKGLVENPIARAKMTKAQLSKAQAKADELMNKNWKVENGCIVYHGDSFDNLCTVKQYGDFEMYVDWMLDPAGPEADAGLYLRGTPQVQIWDTARVNVGAQVGSGGLYNNQKNPSTPLKVADNKLGQWNSFYIKMVGDRVTVYLNGELVVNNVILENYWDRNQSIFPVEQIELQAHGSKVSFRDIYIKELKQAEPFKLSAEEEKEGFRILFDGTNMHQWTGNTKDYVTEDGCIVLYPQNGGGGNLYTKEEFGNFIYRFEFQLTPAANNGLGIRTPLEGDAAYVGMELQILDNEHEVYKDLAPYQYHGSVYGIIPAKRGFLKPIGEWNYQEVIADGNHIKVILNGTVIVDGDIKEATKNGTPDHREHPGLFNKKGHIGFLGHGSVVKFRNIRIKELK